METIHYRNEVITMTKISFPALRCVQNKKTFIVTIMKGVDLMQMCFVSRRNDDPKKGFQRFLSEQRAKAIAAYLDNGEGVIPSALILSAQTKAKMHIDVKTGLVSMERVNESLLVLDGQHRLYGLYEAKKEYEIPVVIFNSLNPQEEIGQFIDINTKQKGVPTALLLDIKGQAGTENEIEERQRMLFDKLNSESVLAGYLSPFESKTGKISRPTFAQATKPILTSGPISDKSDDVVYKAISSYLTAVDRLFKRSGSKDARLTKNVLFKAFFSVFNEVCDKCLVKYGKFKASEIEQFMDPLKDMNFSDYTGTNKVTENKIVADIRMKLREDMDLDEDAF